MKTNEPKTGKYYFLPTGKNSFPLKNTASGKEISSETRINTGLVNSFPLIPTIPTDFSDLEKNTKKAWLWLLILPNRVEPLGVNPPCDREHINNFAQVHGLTLVDAVPIYDESAKPDSVRAWKH